MPVPSLPTITGLLDALQCGAALLRRDRTLAHINPRLAELLGRPAGDVIGRPVHELYTDPDARAHLDLVTGGFDESNEGEYHLEHADGHRVPVIFAARPLRLTDPDADAAPVYRVITIIEISEQKAAFDEVARLGDTVIHQALELRRLNESLEQRVAERTAELHDANMDAIRMLAVASEARDEDTGDHINRIEAYAYRLARAAGLAEPEAKQIAYSAILHDVGKIQIPDDILKKPGRLTDAERTHMQRHTVIGQRILSDKPFFRMARAIARSHHENWDGSGYPDGLVGDQAPLPARITHLVDVFDALVSRRAYKRPWEPGEAIDEIRQHRGTMFEPTLVDALVGLYETGELNPLLPTPTAPRHRAAPRPGADLTPVIGPVKPKAPAADRR